MTILPYGKLKNPLPTISDSCWAFPICGILVGAIIYLSFCVAIYFNIPPLISAVLAISIGIIVTGGFHEDGLADTSDGFFGGRGIKSKLLIMKDSNLGSFGILALIIAIFLRILILSEYNINIVYFHTFITVSALSRYNMLLILYILPPVRKKGLGFKNKITNIKPLIFAFIVPLIGLILLKYNGLIIFILMQFSLLLLIYLAWRKIRGYTGDICGASQIITETVGWFVFIQCL